ncbi:hypothetical protein BsIDN1_18500 [Bacillus safensis]|uniref:Uncharacterized protein n=1 Tax=Bacillus safensis TaxID=561879 RepID=A0A5S9M6H2_BACIA|nr:hypothetical protein BsIDN1_18500 [Bacillus safensis]
MKADLKKELLDQKQADTNEIQNILNKLVKDADVKVKDKELQKTFKEKSEQPAQKISSLNKASNHKKKLCRHRAEGFLYDEIKQSNDLHVPQYPAIFSPADPDVCALFPVPFAR